MLRLLLASPLALLMALLLFVALNSMVHFQQNKPEERAPAGQLFIQLQQDETEVQRRQRRLPEPPKPMPEPPAQTSARPQQQQQSELSQAPANLVPAISMTSTVQALNVSAPVLSKTNIVRDQDAVLLHNVMPEYPDRARRLGIEGYIVVSFDIDESGKPMNIKVIEAKPKRVFEQNTIRAITRRKYQPHKVNGEFVKKTGVTVQLDFKLDE